MQLDFINQEYVLVVIYSNQSILVLKFIVEVLTKKEAVHLSERLREENNTPLAKD